MPSTKKSSKRSRLEASDTSDDESEVNETTSGGEDVVFTITRRILSKSQKADVLKLVEESLTATRINDEQKQEILHLIDLGIDSSNDNDETGPSSSSAPSRALPFAKSEMMTIIEHNLALQADSSTRNSRKRYSTEQKAEVLALVEAAKAEGLSGNAAIKYLNTIPGYDSIRSKMIRDWKIVKELQPRGRKICEEFEDEVLQEARRDIDETLNQYQMSTENRRVDENSGFDYSLLKYHDIKLAARRVLERSYDGEQKWLLNDQTKNLQFSSNWVRKVLQRFKQRMSAE